MATKKTIRLADDMNVQGPNLAIWLRNEVTNPAAVKPITGRQYQGTSPSPAYLVAKATNEFGPVGHGFGWRVLMERWSEFPGGTWLHTCRIEFWWRQGAEIASFEEYGETKIAYETRDGRQMVDDDGSKKSLTDAIVKALSRLGFGGDIFLGHWDDQKYVAELEQDFGAPEAPMQPAPPPAPQGGRAAAKGAAPPTSLPPPPTPAGARRRFAKGEPPVRPGPGDSPF